VEKDPSSPNRRFTDTDSPGTVVGPGTTVRGDVTGGDAVQIRGLLEGDCRTSGHCVVSQGARVVGSIEATGIVVAGVIEGGALAAEKVEIRASARVRASVTGRVVAIADGAFYEGAVQMEGQDAPTGAVFFKERRSGSEGPSRT
jgi:cytoskeletal protein CcmA (bactofilin family)